MDEFLQGMGALVTYLSSALASQDASDQWIYYVPEDLQQISYDFAYAVLEWIEMVL